VTETEWTMLHHGEGGFESAAPPRTRLHHPPSRTCDRAIAVETSQAQAALYRLNGDLNPLHMDPEVAARAGFERPILHGLCTLSMAALALSRAVIPLHRLTYLEASFRAPVYPGDTLINEAWTEGNEAWFQANTTHAPRGMAIRHGYMRFGP
jgi:acyl dehydratase